jgi:hypothetical protein
MEVAERSRSALIRWQEVGVVRGKKIAGTWYLNVDDVLYVLTLSKDERDELSLTPARWIEARRVWYEEQQRLTYEAAERLGAEWEATEEEILDVTRGELTATQVAIRLGRSYAGAATRRCIINEGSDQRS